MSKLKSLLSKPKDQIDSLEKHGIYKLNCPCGMFYIGRTIRNFKTRCKEHTSQIKSHLKRGSHITSAFSNHMIDSGHSQLLDNNFKPQILYSGGNSNFLNSLEALEILHHKQCHNKLLLNNISEFSANRFLPNAIKNL